MSRQVTFANIEAQSSSNDLVERQAALEGLRDPTMTTKQRKLVRILAHLGLETYKDMVKDQEKIKNALVQIGEELGISSDDESEVDVTLRLYGQNGIVERQQRLFNILGSLRETLDSHWKFLFKLPANFERFDPDGIKFLSDLMELDPNKEVEVGPIALISMDPEISDS